MVSKYKKGANQEYRIKKHLEMKGFVVLRSAGSHGFADLTAIDIKTKQIWFIQVKTYKDSMGEKAIKNMIERMPIEEGEYNVKLKVL